MKHITPAELARLGGVSQAAISQQVKAGSLKFPGGRESPLKLWILWDKTHDPSRRDKIGPALRKIIEERGGAVPVRQPATVENVPREPKKPRLSRRASALDGVDENGAPLYLSPEMRAWWKRVTDEYDLESDALLLLQTAATAFDRATEARKLIEREGVLIDRRKNPACDVELQNAALFVRSMKALGLDLEPENHRIGRPPGRR